MSSFLSYSGLQRLWTNGWKTKFVPTTDQQAAPTLSGANAFVATPSPTAITVNTSVTQAVESIYEYTLSVSLSSAITDDLYIFFRCQGQPYQMGGNLGRTVVIPAGATSISYTENIRSASLTGQLSCYDDRGAATIEAIFDSEILNEDCLADKYTFTLNKSYPTRGDKKFAFVSIANPSFVTSTSKFTGSFTYRIISSNNQQATVISASQIIVVRPGPNNTKEYYSYSIGSGTGSGNWVLGNANSSSYTHQPTGTVLNKYYTRSLSGVSMSSLTSTNKNVDPTVPVNCCYMVFTDTGTAKRGITVLLQRYYELTVT